MTDTTLVVDGRGTAQTSVDADVAVITSAISRKILFVDDDVNLLKSLSRQLRRGFDVTVSKSARDAVEIVRQKGPFAVVVADYKMSQMNGIEFLQKLHHLAPDTVAVMLTVWAQLDVVVSALHEGGIFRFLTKPCPRRALEVTLTDCLEQYRHVSTEQRLKSQLRTANETLHTLNEQLAEAHAGAEAANRAKSAFLANMSHEIRTPMNGVLCLTQLLLRTKLTRQQRQHLGMIMTSGESLLQIINDILDLSKIEAGRVAIDSLPFVLRDVVKQTAKAMATQAAAKELDFTFDVAVDVPDTLLGDPGRLRQILLNLMGNAIKFTEHGHVAVFVELDSQGPDICTLHFIVRDTGIGIKDEKMELIFNVFSQADPSTSRKFGGTGLGLTISRRLVEMMGGRIWAESDTGNGSKFHCTIPFALQEQPSEETVGTERAPAPNSPSADTPSTSWPLRILLVEDDAINQTVAVGMLEGAGHTIVVVDNGLKAVEAVQNERFDVVLMDMQMPGMDGFEATATIRKMEASSGAHVPIIALTAHAMSGDRERCLKAGMDEYVTKPLFLGAIRDAIARALPHSPSANATDRSPQGVSQTVPVNAFDKDELLSRLGGNTGLAVSIVETFLKESPKLLDVIHRALACQDYEAMRTPIHQLTGTLSNFSVLNASAAVGTLYRSVLENEDRGCAKEAFDILQEQIQQIRPPLADFARDYSKRNP